MKAVTETDRTRIDEDNRVEAECPKCGDRQILYAHRVLKITVEPPDTRTMEPA